MHRALRLVPLVVVATLIAGAPFMSACEMIPVEAGASVKKTKKGLEFEGHVGDNGEEVTLTRPANLPIGVSWVDADGNPVGGATNVIIPSTIAVPEGAEMLVIGRPIPNPSGGDTGGGDSSGQGGGGNMAQAPYQNGRSQALEAHMSGDRLHAIDNWQVGFPLKPGQPMYYVETTELTGPHSHWGLYEAIRPVLEGGSSVQAPAGIIFEMLVRTEENANGDWTVEVMEQEAFSSFMMAFNKTHLYAMMNYNSVMSEANGWHTISVDIPVDDIDQSWPRALNSSSAMWTTENDGPGHYATWQMWSITGS